jgi:hypothetical protein
MVSARNTELQAIKESDIETSIRKYRPPNPIIDRFMWSRDAINERQRITMEESVDIYLNQLKEEYSAGNYQLRELTGPEIPPELMKPNITTRDIAEQITTAFDQSTSHGLEEVPINVIIPPDLEIAKKFREYLTKNGQVVSTVLTRALGPAIDQSLVTERSSPKKGIIFDDPMYEGVRNRMARHVARGSRGSHTWV